MTWTREMEDHADAWSWGDARACGNAWENRISPFLEEYEKKKWGEIDSERTGKRKKRRQKHCYYNSSQIIREAYDRLLFLHLDDFTDCIFRFRLSGKERLYGFRVSTVFHYVWWDPNHLLYLGKED